MSSTVEVTYVPKYNVAGASLHHTSLARPEKYIPLKGLESFVGVANLLQVPPPLNLKESMGTTRPDGMWSKDFEGTLFPRIMQYFTKYPGKLYKLLTEPLLVTPEGDLQNGRKSLPNVSFYVAFLRQALGDPNAKTYWVDPVSYSKDPTKTSVLDCKKLLDEVKTVLLPSFTEGSISFDKHARESTRECSSSEGTMKDKPLVLACYHGWVTAETTNAFATAGFKRDDFVDVNVTGTKGFDSDLVKNGIFLANAVEQRSFYDKPDDGHFGPLVYSADVFAGFQIMMPTIFDGLGLLKQVLVSCYRKGKIDINDPLDVSYFGPMMEAYVAYLRQNKIEVPAHILAFVPAHDTVTDNDSVNTEVCVEHASS